MESAGGTGRALEVAIVAGLAGVVALDRAALARAERGAGVGVAAAGDLAIVEAGVAGVGHIAGVGAALATDSLGRSAHRDGAISRVALVGEVHASLALARREGEGFAVALRNIATGVGAVLGVAVTVFVGPAILAVRILVMLITVIGIPAIHAAAFAMLIAVVFVPAIIAVVVEPVVRMATSRLGGVGRRIDADRVSGGDQTVEAI